jgi:hypothetical protein
MTEEVAGSDARWARIQANLIAIKWLAATVLALIAVLTVMMFILVMG